MPRRSPRLRLFDIIRGVDLLDQALADTDLAAFEADFIKQAAVVRFLEVIGEAARHVPEDVQAKAPDVPWSDIVGMRNLLIHGYFEVDVLIVWQTATVAARTLRAAVQRLLAGLPEE